MVKVSIIIPIYNAEKYLSRCIDSILNNDYKNIEIILMNDGSTDNSKFICEYYCEKYNKFIRLYNNKNQGVAITRNKGLKYASGEYVMFIDNDDWIDSNYISTYVKELKDSNYDAIYGGYKRVNSEKKILDEVILSPDIEFSKYKVVAPWAKIYKVSFLKDNNIVFLNSNIGEDIYFNFQVINHSSKIKIIDNSGYNWFYNEKSISNTIHTKIDKNLQFNYLLDELYKVDSRKSIMNEYFFLKTVSWYVFYLLKNNDINSVICEKDYYVKWISKKFPNYKKNKYLKIFGISGEKKSIGFAIYVLFKLNYFNFDNLFLRIAKRSNK